MKTISFTSIRICIFLLLAAQMGRAQTLIVEPRILFDNPDGYIASNEIYTCEDNQFLHVEMDLNTMTPLIVTITFPNGFVMSQMDDAVGFLWLQTDPDANPLTEQFEVISTDPHMNVFYNVNCSVQSVATSQKIITVTSTAPSSAEVHLTISRPTISNGAILYAPTTYVYLQEMTSRTFDVKVNNGRLGSLHVHVNVEQEIDITSMDILFPDNQTETITPISIQNGNLTSIDFDITETTIRAHNSGKLLEVNQTIQFTEHFLVNSCNVNFLPQDGINPRLTSYIITPTCDGVQCLVDGANFVGDANVKPLENELVVNKTSSPLNLCNQFTLEFPIVNPVLANNLPVQSAGKIIESIVIVYDPDVVLMDNAIFKINSIQFMPTTYQNIKTINLAGMNTSIGGLSDLFGIHNVLEYDETITLTVEQLSVNQSALSDCTTGLGGFCQVTVNYRRMCETTSKQASSPGIGSAYYHTHFAEANKTDLVIGDNIAEITYYSKVIYYGIVDGPWTSYQSTASGINCCPTDRVRFVVELPEHYTLLNNAEFHADDGSVTNFSFNPTTETCGNESRYIEMPEDFLWSGYMNFSVAANLTAPCCPIGGHTGSVDGDLIKMYIVHTCMNTSPTCNIDWKFGCDQIPLFIHCFGGCDDGVDHIFPMGTNNFKFNRNNFDTRETPTCTSAIPSSPVEAEDWGYKLQRVYPCDDILVTSQGAASGYDYSGSTITDVGFEINFGSSPAVPITSYVLSSGNFFITPQGGFNCTGNQIPIVATDIVYDTNGADRIWVRMNIPSTCYQDFLQSGSLVRLELHFTVQLADQIAAGFFLQPMIRAQFAAIIDGQTLGSCDSFGDNLTVLNVKPNILQEFDGSHTYSRMNSATCDNCSIRFLIRAEASGGLNGFEDFPNEIRPALKLPENIYFKDLVGLTFSHAVFQGTADLEVNHSITQDGELSLHGVNTTQNVTNICENDIVTPNTPIVYCDYTNGWPSLDKKANSPVQFIDVIFDQECPKDMRSAKIKLNYKALSEECNPQPDKDYIVRQTAPNIQDFLQLDLLPSSNLNLTSNPASIDLTLQYAAFLTTNYLTEITTSVNNAWIYVSSDQPGVTVQSIEYGPVGSPPTNLFLPYNNPGSNYFQLGSINLTHQLRVNFSYDCTLCEPGENCIYHDFNLVVHAGYNCSGYPDLSQLEDMALAQTDAEKKTLSGACQFDVYSVPVHPQPSDLSLEAAADYSSNGFCSDYHVSAIIKNAEEANAYNVLLQATSQPGMELVAATVKNDCSSSNPPVNLPILDPSAALQVWGLADLGYTLNYFPGTFQNQNSTRQTCVDLYYKSTCGESSSMGVDLHLEGDDHCNAIHFVQTFNGPDFTPSIPNAPTVAITGFENYSCGSTNPAEIVLSGYTTGQFDELGICIVLPDVIVLSNPGTGYTSTNNGNGFISHCWNWTNPIANATANFQYTIPAGYCNQGLQISWSLQYGTLNCSSNCTETGTINTPMCCNECAADAMFTSQDNGECNWTFNASTESNSGCLLWTIRDVNNTIVYTLSNVSQMSYSFANPGSYQVCFEECCMTGETPTEAVTHCETINVQCGCSASAAFTYTTTGNCCYQFVDPTQTSTSCSKWVIFDPYGAEYNLDGAIVTFCMPYSGTYHVFLVDCCTENGVTMTYITDQYITCTECTPTADFSYSLMNDCEYHFQDLTPAPFLAEGCPQWTFLNNNGNVIHQAYGVNQTNYIFPSSGSYTVIYHDCCPNSDGTWNSVDSEQTLQVDCVSCDFSASITSTKITDCQIQLTTDLTNISAGCLQTFTWDFGDGTTSQLQNPSHTYEEGGTYHVCVTISNTCQNKECSQKFCIEIVVVCSKDDSFCNIVQNPNVPNDARNDRGKAIQATSDGGCIIIGTVNESYGSCGGSTGACSTNESDIVVTKYDIAGNQEFITIIGEGTNPNSFYNDGGVSVLVRDDGYYILGNVTVSTASQTWDRDMYIAKLNFSGQKVWGQRYGYSSGGTDSREIGSRLVDMSIAGGEQAILVVGYTNRGLPNTSNPNYDFMAIKLNPATGAVIDNGGNVGRRAYFYDSTNSDNQSNNVGFEKCMGAARIETLTGPEYILVGEHSLNGTDKNIFLVRIDQNLLVKGSLLIDNTTTEKVVNEYATGVDIFNKAVIVVGSITNGTNEDAYLVHLNNDLNLVTTHVIGETKTNERFSNVRIMNDGKFMAVGRTGDAANGGDLLNVGYDADLTTLLWSNSSQRNGYDEELSDISSNYIATGYYDNLPFTNNGSDQDQDREILLTRLNPTDGSSCCMSPIEIKSASQYQAKPGAGKRTFNLSTVTYGNYGGTLSVDNLCKPTKKNLTEPGDVASEDMILYPNPNTGQFTIQLSGNNDILMVQIMNVSGQNVKEESYVTKNGGKVSFDTTELTNGLYYVQVRTLDHTMIRRMIKSE